jgi:hypothetical protein
MRGDNMTDERLAVAELRALCRACELAEDHDDSQGGLGLHMRAAMEAAHAKLRRTIAARPKSTRRAVAGVHHSGEAGPPR